MYEIGRDFRNEGVSFKHNPEFTQLEFYWAYADYLKVMALTEEMISHTAQEVLGTQIIHFDGHEIDLSPPWKRIELRQGIIDVTGIDITEHPDAESLAAAMNAKDLKPKPGAPRGKLIDASDRRFPGAQLYSAHFPVRLSARDLAARQEQTRRSIRGGTI